MLSSLILRCYGVDVLQEVPAEHGEEAITRRRRSPRRTPRCWSVALLSITATTMLLSFASPVSAQAILDTASYGGNTYHLVAGTSSGGGITWTAGEAFARTLGGHLATVNDLAEQQFIFSTWGSFQVVGQLPVHALWIGLTDQASEGTFQWISGDAAPFRHWRAGEPNDTGNEDFVYIWSTTEPQVAGLWNDNTDIVSAPPFGPHYAVVEVACDACELAKSSIGAIYQWGGKGYDYSQGRFASTQQVLLDGYSYYDEVLGFTPGTGLDCSGLNFWSFNRAWAGGSPISWDLCGLVCPVYWEGAHAQYQSNTARLAPHQIQAGDLLFFSTKVPGFMNHVAMYVGPFEHNGETYNVVHASGYTDSVTPAVFDLATQRVLTRQGDGSQQLLSVSAYGRVAPPILRMEIIARSPVSLAVTAPDGRRVSVANAFGDNDGLTNEVPGMAYMVRDLDGSGDANDIVALPELQSGSYLVQVHPKADAQPFDTYGLELRLYGEDRRLEQTIVLADNTRVDAIPSAGYEIESDGLTVTPVMRVALDIRPESALNLVSLTARGTIPVAILSNQQFDAPSEVDQTQLTFGHTGSEASLAACKKNSQDVNNDGRADLVCLFKSTQTAFTATTEVGVLRGRTTDGRAFTGTDTVRIAP